MTESTSLNMKQFLLKKRNELQEKLKELKPLQDQLQEVEALLSTYDNPKRGGWEKPGHENGCRCGECDPSW